MHILIYTYFIEKYMGKTCKNIEKKSARRAKMDNFRMSKNRLERKVFIIFSRFLGCDVKALNLKKY